jgi:hypothetical protein
MATINSLYAPQTATSTGPLAPVDISGFVNDWTLICEAVAVSPGQATVNFEESLDGFESFRTLWCVSWDGPLGPNAGDYSAGAFDPATNRQSLRCYEAIGSGPNSTSYMGCAGGEIRANIVQLSAGTTLTFSAWLEL